MTPGTPAPPPAKTKPPGLVSGFIFLIIKLMLLGALAWFLLLLWFLGEAIFQGSFVALHHAQSMVQFYGQFITTHSMPLLHKRLVFGYLFQDYFTRALQFLTSFSNPWIQTALDLLAAVSEIIVSRLMLFLAGLPLLLLVLLVFLVDGLVKRDIRKFKAARETTLIFHRGKYLLGFLFFAPFTLYMSVPLNLNPALYFIIQALLLGIVVHVSAAYFKKYV